MDAKLIMFKEDGERREFVLREGVSTIGRKEDCDLRIPLADISRHHSEVTASDGKVKIRDLDSSNGTFVNLARIEEQELEPGDRVSIGPVVFTLQVDGEPATIEPVRTKLTTQSAATGGGGAQASSDSFDALAALGTGDEDETRITLDDDDLD